MASLVTPSMLDPTVMIVAACVSCCLFRVNVSPFAVVTTRESGTFPTVSPDEARHAMAVGFTTSPTVTSPRVGASNIKATTAIASFFIMSQSS